MTNSTSFAALVARLLMAALFIAAGLGKLGDVQGFAGYLASGGLPAVLAWPAILFEILAGVALLLGWQTRYAALALAMFCVVSAVLYHFVPGDQGQMTQFLKNMALAGGYLSLAALGPGRYSLDARIGGAATRTPA